MFRTRRGRWIAITAAALCTAPHTIRAGPAGDPQADGSRDDRLIRAVTDYFNEADRGKRAGLVTAVREAAGGSLAAVADALGRVQVWQPIAAREETVAVALGDDTRTDVRVTLPDDYDATERHPLILALIGRPRHNDIYDATWLDATPAGFIVARVTDFSACAFNGPRRRADDPRRWLHALKRRYHIDTDRVYLYGSGTGGDAAFLAALMHADLWAGVVIREGMLDLPYHRELQRILLGNLRHTPVHLIWTRPELPTATILTGRVVKVALANQSTTRYAESVDLPITKTVLHPSDPVDPTVGSAILKHRRRASIKDASHWFRYPEQGRTRFVRCGGFDTPIWEGDQVDILVNPAVERSAYVTDVLRSKLAHIAGRIDVQSIEIESTSSDTVEIRLEHGHMDWSRSINIRYNGKRRFSDRLHPDIATLLESAYLDWEFQHPPCLRLRIGQRGRVMPF